MTTMLILTTSLTSYAATSNTIYKQRCASCHLKEGDVSTWHKRVLFEKMQKANKEEREKILAEMHDDMSEDYVAPPFSKVSKRLSSIFDTKEEFIGFVKSYIKEPSREKGHCKDYIFERFGVMPPVKADMSDEDIDKIANWLYNNFKLYRAE